jgi:hypothetical protein
MASNRHLARMTGPRPSPLDEPRNAAHAWRRYRRILKAMTAFSLALIAAVFGVLYALGAVVSVDMLVAAAIGTFLTVMLMSALMGLVFLSSGTGHDESIADPLNDDAEGPGRWP